MWVNDKLTSYSTDWFKPKEGLVIPKWIDYVGKAVQELGKVYSMIGTNKPLTCKKNWINLGFWETAHLPLP